MPWAIDPSTVVFEGFSGTPSGSLKGTYSNFGGVLSKVVDLHSVLNGKTLSGLNLGAFSGNQVSFQALFTDASQGV